jgi:hypothetical protein
LPSLTEYDTSREHRPLNYNVVMGSSSPRSIRFDERVNAQLSSYVARHPGSSASSVANRFVDEALRMDEQPGVLFRDGRTGRRAVLVGGPDVREVIRAVRSARAAEPDLDAAGVVSLVETNTGVPTRLIDTAIRYWSAYPDEIDSWIADVDELETGAVTAWERQRELLGQ